MTAATLTDPRTELISLAADNVHHAVCDDCYVDGMPMPCGAPDDGDNCTGDCGHTTCPICEYEWDRHECQEVGA